MCICLKSLTDVASVACMEQSPPLRLRLQSCIDVLLPKMYVALVVNLTKF